MILPIGHDQSIRRWPYVTIGIIIICTLLQVYSSFGTPSEEELGRRVLILAGEFSEGEETPDRLAEFERRLEDMLDAYPIHRFGYRTGTGLSVTLITSAFVHGGWLHLIGNMLFLWLAGSALEDRYGRARFALFYGLGAIAATLAFEAMAGDGILLVGASGAVSACMGAFLLHFHRAQIRFWYLLMYRSGTFYLPAWVALPAWLVEQFVWASLDGGTGRATGVAYSAHIGGFAFGLVAGFAMSKLFPDDGADDEVVYDEPDASLPKAVARERNRGGPRIDRAVEERFNKCLDAVAKRDVANVRTLSSRVVLDLARAGDDARILELYQAIAKQLTKVPLTVQAFAAAASAADELGRPTAYIEIANAMIADHPFGVQTPAVMWRLAQLHGDSGDHGAEQETLRTLAKRFPRDEHGQRAARALDA